MQNLLLNYKTSQIQMLSPIPSLHLVSQITTIKIIKFCLKHFSHSPMMSSKTRLALNSRENLNV